MMIKINDNIRFIRKKLGLTQEQFANKLTIKRSLIGAYEEGRALPRLGILQKIASIANLSVDHLIGKNVDELRVSNNIDAGNKEELILTLDEKSSTNIELVSNKAIAGYVNGYSDLEYISELQSIKLPFLQKGNYRAFEISGDSMIPIQSGSIIIGERVEKFQSIKSGQVYVLVTREDGIVFKRVSSMFNQEGVLLLVSDNNQYESYQIKAHEIIEIWHPKAYISMQFPDPKDSNDILVEKLTKTVIELKEELRRLKSV